MHARISSKIVLAGIVSAGLWAFAPAPASAFVPASPLTQDAVAPSHIETVNHRSRYHWCRHHPWRCSYHHHRRHWRHHHWRHHY